MSDRLTKELSRMLNSNPVLQRVAAREEKARKARKREKEQRLKNRDAVAAPKSVRPLPGQLALFEPLEQENGQ